jgi:U3 small nucleolar RNA-associated protein MPP10
LEEEQVWAQLELRTKHVCELLDVLLDGEGPAMDEDEDELRQAMEDGGFFLDEEDEQDDEDEDEDEDDMYGEYEVEDEDDSMEEESLDGDEEFIGGIRDEESDSEGESESEAASMPTIRIPPRRKQKQRSEVDDDFFDLADFKAEIEKAESKSSSRGHLAEEDESEDEGLNDVDLFAPVDGLEDVEEEDMKGMLRQAALTGLV